MSKAFTSEEATLEVVVPPRAPLPAGVPNYVTPRGLELLRAERRALEAERAQLEHGPEEGRGAALAAWSARFAELDRRLVSAQRVDPTPGAGVVRFGSRVTIADENGEEKTIEKLLEEGAEAAGRGDAEAVIALLSKSYQAPGQDYAAAVQRIRTEVARGKGLTVEPSGAQIQVTGEEADANVLVRVKAGPRPLGDFGLKLRLRKEGGVWKVVSGEETPRP